MGYKISYETLKEKYPQIEGSFSPRYIETNNYYNVISLLSKQ